MQVYPFYEGVADLSPQFPQYRTDPRLRHSLGGKPHGNIRRNHRDRPQLKQAGWELYLLSNFSTEKFELINLVNMICNSSMTRLFLVSTRLIKPDPEIFISPCNPALDAQAEECLFIDDSLPNIETAVCLAFKPSITSPLPNCAAEH
jgi:hypothetical protein